MNKPTKNTLILASCVLAILLLCGSIGYLNRAGSDSANPQANPDQIATLTPPIKLDYCSEQVELCIVSFGYDNAEHMLIILKNADSKLAGLTAKIGQGAAARQLYDCTRVDFSQGTYYCIGPKISAGSTTTIGIYTKADLLLAQGLLSIQTSAAVPVVIKTSTPIAVLPTQTQKATATPPASYPNKTPSYP